MIVIGTVGQIGNSIDPAGDDQTLAVNLIRNINDGLVDYRPGTDQVVPGLALNWTSSQGGTVWTFDLRQGVTFPDGSEFNASVEAGSASRASNFGVGSYSASGLNSLISNVTATGTYQVQFTLNHPAPVTFVTDISLYPVDPIVTASGELVNYTGVPATENPNGLGAYLLANWTRSGGTDVSVVLTANPNYWNASSGLPKTKTIEIFFYDSTSAMLTDLSSGKLDVAYVDAAFGGISSSDLQGFRNNAAFEVWSGPPALEGSTTAVSTTRIGGVVLDSTDVFRYYTLTKQ